MRSFSLGVLAVAVSLAAGSPPASAEVSGSDQVSDEARFVDLINAERAKVGLAALRVVPELVGVGREWSTEMISRAGGPDRCGVVHNPDFVSKVTADWQRLGENVGCGKVSVATLHDLFVASPAHYRNIVDPTFDSVGIGVAYDGDVMYVTEQFMDLRDVPSVSAPNELANRTPGRKAGTRIAARRIRR